jgi:hypothetical protein
MTEHQLTIVRRYWLGRVIVFDSLRRQRQNQLVQMHLQLAAQATMQQKEVTPLRQIWSAFKAIFLPIFYVLRALISFFLGFFFIRVTIANLARGTLIESMDLPLIMRAKQSVEASAKYLKDYLLLAESFDGREDLIEPQ